MMPVDQKAKRLAEKDAELDSAIAAGTEFTK